MSYPYDDYPNKKTILAALSNEQSVNYLYSNLVNQTVIPVLDIIALMQSAPTSVDQMDYILDYFTDVYITDVNVGLDAIDDDYLEILTRAIEINNNEIKHQIEKRLGIHNYDIPEFLELTVPHHSIFKIRY